MKVTIYGPGCHNCKKTEEVVSQVLTELQQDFQLEKVADYQQIAQAGVLTTPAVKIDGVLMSKKAKIPTEQEVRAWVQPQ